MDGPFGDDAACPSCGEHVEQQANFCRHCGETLGGEQPTDPEAHDRSASRGSPPGDRAERPDPRHTEGGSREEGNRHVDDTQREHGPHRHDQTWDEPATAAGPGQGGYADLPQWRAYLPPQVRPNEQSQLRVALGAAGLVGASILATLVVSLVGGIVGAAVGLALGSDDMLRLGALGGAVVGNFAAFAVFALSYLRWRGFDRDRIVSYLGVRRPTLVEIGLVVGTAVVMVVAAGVLTSLVLQLLELVGIEATPAENSSTQILENNPSPLLAAGGVLFMFLVVGPTEELLFRGVVQGRLRERLSAPKAIAIASVLFGSIHLLALSGGGPAGIATMLAVLSIVAVALGALYEYTGNLVVSALAHGLYNSILVVGLYITTTTDIESGGVVLLDALVTLL